MSRRVSRKKKKAEDSVREGGSKPKKEGKKPKKTWEGELIKENEKVRKKENKRES